MTACGVTPYSRHNCARPTCMAKIRGWIRSTPVSSPLARTSRGEKPISAVNTGSSSSRTAANAGSASSSRPMPAHCEPCPENTKTGPGPGSGSTWPIVTVSLLSPAASARSPAASALRSVAAITARWARCDRRSASVCPRPASGRSASPTGPASRSAVCRRAGAELAETGKSSPTGSCAALAAGSGACSTRTCAIVPPYPNAETAARRGCSH